jgi:hypothetical protein
MNLKIIIDEKFMPELILMTERIASLHEILSLSMDSGSDDLLEQIKSDSIAL